MKKTYRGSCHCGRVRFEADLDLAERTGKCNCSICRKTRSWAVTVRPADFRLLAGEGELADYQFGTRSLHHEFCRHCGVRPFGRGHLDVLGGDFVTVSLTCLDDVSDDELASAPVAFANGRDDDWRNAPMETRYL